MEKTYHGCKADKFDYDEAADCEEDSTTLTKAVIENLRNWLGERACENCGWIAHTEAQHNVEEETSKVGEEHSEGDGPRSLNLWLGDFFRDMCRCIIISHGPRDGQKSE